MQNFEGIPNTSEILRLATADFLNNPEGLRETLTARGALEFTPYPSGLFPASALTRKMGEATGMGMAWLRDNAFVINTLHATDRPELAIPAGQAILQVLDNNRNILDNIVNGDTDPKDPANRLPIRVRGDTLVNDEEHRVQNDSVGYAIWAISRLIKNGALQPSTQDLDNIAQTVRYLEKIEYWQDVDQGHWEEDNKIHASSIGVVIAGLREAEQMFRHVGYRHDIDLQRMRAKGKAALHTILDQGVTEFNSIEDFASPPKSEPLPKGVDGMLSLESIQRHFESLSTYGRRKYDAALLFLVEPLQILEGEQAEKIVLEITEHLQRDNGFARYLGDTYWSPRFTDIMTIEERTRQAEGRLEKRNAIAAAVSYARTEAQWTLSDPLLSVYWGKLYAQSGDKAHRDRQLYHLDRSLSQLVPQPDGKLLLPEAYYYEYEPGLGINWEPNDHTPLLWSQANLLSALQTFEATPQSS